MNLVKIQNWGIFLEVFFLNNFYNKMNYTNEIENMRKNSPSIFHRIPFNFNTLLLKNIEKDDDDNIILERQHTLSIEDIEMYSEDKEFKAACLEACKICKENILKFKIALFVIRFWAAFICSMVSFVSEYNLSINISLTITIFGSFILALDILADWNKMIEKYAHIFKEFFDLSFSKDINKNIMFKNLVLKYNSNLLFSDIYEQINLIN